MQDNTSIYIFHVKLPEQHICCNVVIPDHLCQILKSQEKGTIFSLNITSNFILNMHEISNSPLYNLDNNIENQIIKNTLDEIGKTHIPAVDPYVNASLESQTLVKAYQTYLRHYLDYFKKQFPNKNITLLTNQNTSLISPDIDIQQILLEFKKEPVYYFKNIALIYTYWIDQLNKKKSASMQLKKTYPIQYKNIKFVFVGYFFLTEFKELIKFIKYHQMPLSQCLMISHSPLLDHLKHYLYSVQLQFEEITDENIKDKENSLFQILEKTEPLKLFFQGSINTPFLMLFQRQIVPKLAVKYNTFRLDPRCDFYNFPFNQYRKFMNYNNENISIITDYNFCLNNLEKKSSRHWLFASQNLSDDSAFVAILVKLMRNYPEKKLIIKLHPTESHHNKLKQVLQYAKTTNIQILKNKCINDLVEHSELIFTAYSSVIFDAFYLKIPVIFFSYQHEPHQYKNLHFPESYNASNYDELVSVVSNLVEHYPK